MRRALLIVGCHRSGTSALTHALGFLGWNLPRHLMPANQANLLGYWEPLPIVRFNESLLEQAGRNWLDPKPLCAPMTLSAAARETMTGLLDEEFPGAEPFVFKDPRLSRLMPVWRSLLESNGVSPSVILACRNPAQVCRSLEDRDHMPNDHAAELWLTYTLESEYFSRGLPRTAVCYEDLIDNPRSTLDRALGAIGADTGTISEADWNTATSALRRVEGSAGKVERRSNPFVAECYDLLKSSPALSDTAGFDTLRQRWLNNWRAREDSEGHSRLALERPETRLALAKHALAAGKAAEALREAELSAQIASRDGTGTPALHVGLSQLFDDAGEPDLALEQNKLAEALDPDNPALHLAAARILRKMGRVAGAESAYRAVIALDAANDKANEQLGLLLFQTGRAGESLPFIASSVAANPGRSGLLHLQALALTKAGHVQDAIGALNRAIERDSTNETYREALGRLLRLQKRT